MKHQLFILSVLISSVAFADDVRQLSPTVVTATRVEQNSFDLPVSIDVVEKKDLEGQLGMTLSESLIRVPGITAQNRTQMAQDPQISTRGFGARSTFGVRGVRVYVDGIPLSTPDGIATPGNIDLGSLKSIEVMRGPFSSLYGSSSGGIIQLRTQDPSKELDVGGGYLFGSYDTNKSNAYTSGTKKDTGYYISYSNFSSDGYRKYSESEKDQATIKLQTKINEDTKITALFNWIDQKANDPGGLTAAEVRTSRTFASANNLAQLARVQRDNKQIGFNLEHKFNENNSLNLITYLGERNNLQYLYSAVYSNDAFKVPLGTTFAPAGRASSIARDFWGTDLRFTNAGRILERPYQLTFGMAYGYQNDHRTDDMAYLGNQLTGSSNYNLRNEKNIADNFDQYAQAQWSAFNNVDLHGGIRHTKVTFENQDSIIGSVSNATGSSGFATREARLTFKNNNGSGKVSHEKTTPVIGATFKITPTFNLYGNFGKGFETPTFIEMAYSDITGLGPNLNLKPSTSDNYEIGSKFFIGNNIKFNFAAFKTNTKNEIVTYDSNSAYSVFTNAGNTQRKGLELSGDFLLPNNFNFYTSLTYLDAQFKSSFTTQNTATYYEAQTTGSDAFKTATATATALNPIDYVTTTTVNSGNKISGTYRQQLYAELSYKYPSLGFSAALEGRSNSRVWANDSNTAYAAGYAVYNLRAGFEQLIQNWKISEFARIENIFDKDYVGSIKNNDSNSRFYETAPGTNYLLGINASYQFK
jgi:iron complex outermembrane receptor protein